jgi:hypothetical protein
MWLRDRPDGGAVRSRGRDPTDEEGFIGGKFSSRSRDGERKPGKGKVKERRFEVSRSSGSKRGRQLQ